MVGTWGRGFGGFSWLVVVVCLVASAAQDVDLSGKWRMSLEMEVGRATPLLELTQKGSKLSGTYTGRYGASPVEGTVEGRKVAFSVALETTSLSFQGELKDDGTLAGKASFGEMGEVRWTAQREKTESSR